MRTLLDFVIKGLAACAAAFQFLTRLPVPVKLQYDDALFRRSVVFYPWVGAVVGLLLSLTGLLLRGDLLAIVHYSGIGPGVTAALLLVLWVAVTGALHLDGLMDTADGIFSHRSREQMLEIMKDSRVGAMGVVTCVLLMLCKWTLLQQWLTLPAGVFASVLPLAAIWSRWFMVVAIAYWPYARAGQAASGLGGFFRGLGIKHILISTAGAVILSMLLSGWTEPSLFSWHSLTVAGTAFATAVLLGTGISVYLNRKLGGLTGDTYGALNEVLETVLLFILYIMIGK